MGHSPYYLASQTEKQKGWGLSTLWLPPGVEGHRFSWSEHILGREDVTGYTCVLKLVASDRNFPHKTFMISNLFETLHTCTPVYIEWMVLSRKVGR